MFHALFSWKKIGRFEAPRVRRMRDNRDCDRHRGKVRRQEKHAAYCATSSARCRAMFRNATLAEIDDAMQKVYYETS